VGDQSMGKLDMETPVLLVLSAPVLDFLLPMLCRRGLFEIRDLRRGEEKRRGGGARRRSICRLLGSGLGLRFMDIPISARGNESCDWWVECEKVAFRCCGGIERVSNWSAVGTQSRRARYTAQRVLGLLGRIWVFGVADLCICS
jgi:hypothetical protein